MYVDMRQGQALGADGLVDLAEEYLQVGLDEIIASEAVSEFPIVQSLGALVRAGVSVRDRLFARKLLDFLSGFRDIGDWERRDMVVTYIGLYPA
jgi:hypothetical protein